NENANEDKNADQENEAAEDEEEQQADGSDEKPEIVLENEAFRIFEPAPNAVVGNEFTVRGEARVFEASFMYEFEDGHNILDEGNVTASTGAPDWGEFEITITFDEVAYDTGTVILYDESQKDGSRQNELFIPVTVEK
ncbi:Gmad2 immunoglobulin-like domain-containing protein, partial [Ralstonia pickettii]|nr:Gmad2 immunoglobulin-like domain-containing protein [Ralstonia pickettii]